ncbi:MAG: tRNA (adenosine(37)-N6)-dimethylallyltransferase MiaA, partial [Proteobacteria bacterium]|nr:tRNA (adenosine(37)-N6)-dimethylallyltransferase MiaA [Pseudomonadota bacterium]
MSTRKNAVIIIAGPTASGKSARAMETAQKHDGIIINADSMQIYDALPLLTAQPGADDMNRAPHALYAALHPKESCSAQSWRGMALREIKTAHRDGKTPVITGGTGFYIKALMRGLSPIPDVPAEIRARITARQKEMGNLSFHVELKKLDPEMAARLNPNDTQRLIRAREVL